MKVEFLALDMLLCRSFELVSFLYIKFRFRANYWLDLKIIGLSEIFIMKSNDTNSQRAI